MPQNSETSMYIGVIVLLLLCMCSSCIAIIGVSIAFSSVKTPSVDTCKDFITKDSCKDRCDDCTCSDPTLATCSAFLTADNCKSKCGITADSCKSFIPSSADYELDFTGYSRTPNKVCRPDGATDAANKSTMGTSQDKGNMSVAQCKKTCDDDPKCNCFDMGQLTYKDGVVSGQCYTHQDDKSIVIPDTSCQNCMGFLKNKAS